MCYFNIHLLIQIMSTQLSSGDSSDSDQQPEQNESTPKKKRKSYTLEYKCKVIVQSAGKTTVEMASKTGKETGKPSFLV